MPVAPRFLTTQLQSLAEQIARAPLHVKAQQLTQLETLLFDLEDERLYPFDYVVFRVTGLRLEISEQSNMIGSALKNDLVAAIAIVSRTMDMKAGVGLSLIEVAEALGVSQRTVNRLRHEGLPFLWVVDNEGNRRLQCKETHLDLFKESRKRRIQQASAFSRLTASEKKNIVEFALSYKGQGKTINEVASDLKSESGRGLETIRAILKGNEQVSSELPLSKPLTRQDARDIEAAIQSGASWNALATEYKRTKNAMRGAIARLRRDRLKRLSIPTIELPVFSMKDAREVLLSPEVVRSCLPPLTQLNIFELEESATAIPVQDETAIVAAMYVLRRSAKEHLSSIQYTPTEGELDAIETDLRWAWLLQQTLMLSALPAALSVATQHAGRALTELPVSDIEFYVGKALAITEQVCSTIDPKSNQTVAKLTALTVDRAISNIDIVKAPTKATAKPSPDAQFRSLHEHSQWSVLVPTMTLSDAEQCSQLHSEVFKQKFGWCGYPKRTVELASVLDESYNAIARALKVLH